MTRPTSSRKLLAALASPARQELVAVLGEGSATVRELGARLGRSRQALYYHLGELVRAGFARIEGEEAGPPRERRYGLVSTELALAAHRSSSSELALAVRTTEAMLRLTAREFAAASRNRRAMSSRKGRGLLAMRGKAWLSRAQLRKLNGLLDQIHALLATPPGRRERRPRQLYALTVVLTPARAAEDAESARAEPEARRESRR